MMMIKNVIKSIKRKKMIETAKVLSLSVVLGAAAGAVTALLLKPKPKPIVMSLNQVKEHATGVMDSGRAKLDKLVNLSKHKVKKHMSDCKVKHN